MFSTFLETPHPEFPFLCLVVSGGHTLLVHVRSVSDYQSIGSTIDDAAGEAYDKVGKMLGLGFPGGPVIDERAARGNADAVRFPRPLLDSDDFSFSFSGLKTAVLYHLRKQYRDVLQNGEALPEAVLDDLCASFQRAVTDVLVAKALRAAASLGVRDIALAGGVSANRELRSRLSEEGAARGLRVFIPAPSFTTDNAAMIAQLGYLRHGAHAIPTLHAPAFARVSGAMRHAKA
jgi:N6-L-threonylcarbamoyladenine synthase